MADQFDQVKNEDFPHQQPSGNGDAPAVMPSRQNDLHSETRARKANQTFSELIAGMDSEQITQGLGWFSIGLGIVEMLAPRTLSRMIGVRYHPVFMRVFGAREATAGIGILTHPNQPAGWLWARVAGDVLDLASLGWAFNTDRRGTAKRIAAVAAVAGVTALDVMCAQGYTKVATDTGFESSVTIGKSPRELYDLWREPQIMSQVMGNFAEVRKIDEEHMHWVIPGFMGSVYEFDAKSVEQRPGELIRWKSISGAVPPNGGEVLFRPAPGDRGTEVTLRFKLESSANILHQAAFTLIPSIPKTALWKALMRFKSLAETGELPSLKNNPSARRSAA